MTYAKKAMTACLITAGVFALGCKENEISLFVEHMKAPPTAPNCSTTAGDETTPGGLLDLSFRSPYSNYFLLRNSLMGREDYKNTRAETNGVFIEGVEVSVSTADGTPIGSPEYHVFEGYIEPESADIVFGVVVPKSVVDVIADNNGCRELTAGNYPPTDASGQFDAAGTIDRGEGVDAASAVQQVYASLRFLGHTNAGRDVETPTFTILIRLCCGCLVDWSTCDASLCERYCEEPDQSQMCSPGVGAGEATFDCRNLYAQINSWEGGCVDENGQPRLCTCDDCEG